MVETERDRWRGRDGGVGGGVAPRRRPVRRTRHRESAEGGDAGVRRGDGDLRCRIRRRRRRRSRNWSRKRGSDPRTRRISPPLSRPPEDFSSSGSWPSNAVAGANGGLGAVFIEMEKGGWGRVKGIEDRWDLIRCRWQLLLAFVTGEKRERNKL